MNSCALTDEPRKPVLSLKKRTRTDDDREPRDGTARTSSPWSSRPTDGCSPPAQAASGLGRVEGRGRRIARHPLRRLLQTEADPRRCLVRTGSDGMGHGDRREDEDHPDSEGQTFLSAACRGRAPYDRGSNTGGQVLRLWNGRPADARVENAARPSVWSQPSLDGRRVVSACGDGSITSGTVRASRANDHRQS
jgi:hypothetical protein